MTATSVHISSASCRLCWRQRSEVFVPALNDAYRASLGIGDAALPTTDGGTAAVVVLKCRRGELRVLAAAVDEVLTDPDRFAGAPPA